jgi:surface antigen
MCEICEWEDEMSLFKKKDTKHWGPGDKVRVTTDHYGGYEVNHYGEIGVVTYHLTDENGNYYHVAFSEDPLDWRGYYEDWLEEV